MIIAIISIFYSFIAFGAEKPNIIYLDGLMASGKSSVAQELAKLLNAPLLSADDLAKKEKITYYQAALKVYQLAIKKSKKTPSIIILDSFVIENAIENKFIKLVGIFCQLDCLKMRFDQRAGKKDAWENSILVSEYQQRYGNKTTKEIISTGGLFLLDSKIEIKYDLFLNSENQSPSELALQIKEYFKL